MPGDRPRETLAVTRGTMRLLRSLGSAPLTEVPLANGRRADIMAVGADGRILIVEVKSGLDDWRVDLKWPHYGDYCDALAFAVGPAFPVQALPAEIGLIVADAYGGAFVREPVTTSLAPARRKALLIQFGRLAAGRIHRFADPEGDFPDA